MSKPDVWRSTPRALRGTHGRIRREVGLTPEQWAKIDRLAAAHGGRPEALGAMVDAFPESAEAAPAEPGLEPVKA